MGLFSFGKPISSVQKKSHKKVVKKAVKKIKPPISVSLPASQLADKFVLFVLSLPSDNNKRRKPQRSKWAEQIQEFTNYFGYGCLQIQAVFDWYSLHYQELWRIESPKSFIKHFSSLLKRYNRSINPYSAQQLEPLMERLLRLQWDCRISELELAVGRSLWMAKQLRYVINVEKLIQKKYRLVLNSRIGDESDFVQCHFEKWFWGHANTEHVRFAEITKKKMLNMAYKWFSAYGIDNITLDRITSKLDYLKEIGFDSEVF
jgi:hypothetical protein